MLSISINYISIVELCCNYMWWGPLTIFCCYYTSAKWLCFCRCLSVCLLATLRKNFQSDLHESFREGWQWASEQLIKFWWLSGSPSGYRDCFSRVKCTFLAVVIWSSIYPFFVLRREQTSMAFNTEYLLHWCTYSCCFLCHLVWCGI